MDKSLKVYPIPTGNMLNVFSTEDIAEIRILNMTGVLMYSGTNANGKSDVIDIKGLPTDTYIVEVFFDNHKSSRSMFVKL